MLIRGATVWSEQSGARADVRVEGGKVVELGDLQPRPDEKVLDAGGLHVLPGMIDAHVHAADRIGRFELADSWESASRAALATGITTLAGFVTQHQDETLTAAVDRCTARATGAGCEIRFHLTPTVWPWDWDEVAALIARGFTTFKLYTTYREAGLFSSYERLAEVMPRLAELGATLLVHCEDDASLLDPEAADADLADPYSHARLRPEAAEVEAVRRVVELAESSGCRIHVVHVSTADAAEAVAAVRRRGIPVSCETAPHYLLLESSRLGDPEGSRTLCTPPLRPEATRQRLEELAAAGAFDLLATDHCAFTKKDKDGWSGSDFRVLPSGVAGVGALAPLAFELLVHRHGRPMSELVRLLAAGPARLLGIYPRKGVVAVGSDADLAIVDPEGPSRPIRSTEADAWETWSGRTTSFHAKHVIRVGEIVI